ncbi:MAG: GNAT family N-acetyltransferase [Maricaulaceae bacterium]
MSLTLKTDRLILRPPEDGDAEAVARAIGDIEVARNLRIVPHPYPPEAALGWFVFVRIGVRRGTNFTWLIFDKTNQLAGCIGVFKRGSDPDWEVGYWMAKTAWGRGYATEALEAIVGWVGGELGANRLVAGYFDDNPASRRVLEKAGFKPTGCAGAEYALARNASAICVGMALDIDDARDAA